MTQKKITTRRAPTHSISPLTTITSTGELLDNRSTTKPKIINMSSRELSSNEIKLLKKGLKFTPIPRRNETELKTDIQEFGRELRLLEHFDNHQQEQENSLIINKFNFVPPKPSDQYPSAFLQATSNYHQDTPPMQKNYISKEERKALRDLKNDNSIIIKEADKGGATVIMDKTFCRSKIQLLRDVEN